MHDVFDEYLAHCEARVRRDDLASATLRGYRKVLDGVWRPALGQLLFYDVTYSQLVAIADKRDWSKKTYNNALSVLRRAFDFGYRDRPLEANPPVPCAALACAKPTAREWIPFACTTPKS